MGKNDTPSGNALRYGRTKLGIPSLFANANVLSVPEVPEIKDFETTLRDLLQKPTGCSPLKEFVKKDDVVTIVVSDMTRPSAANRVLPVILEEISHASQIRILIALGLHRKLSEEELKKLLGWKVAKTLPVFQHDPEASSRLIYLGRTRCGTEIQLSRFLLPEDTYRKQDNQKQEQSLKIILTGAIAPHYFYGFSGGRKSILPGCASKQSIMDNHSLVLGEDGQRPQECRAGNLLGNPCHLDSIDAAHMVSNTFVINTVHTGPVEVACVTAGDLEKAHLEGCRFYMENCAVTLEEKYDVVLASCGGYPRDLNFIQAHKAIEYAFHAVKPGGTLVIAAECPEGSGSEEFFKWFKYDELDEFYNALRKKYEVYGQTAYATFWKAKKVDILLVSSLDPKKVRNMSITPVSDLEEAAQIVSAKYGQDFTSCIMPYASDTLIRDESLKLE